MPKDAFPLVINVAFHEYVRFREKSPEKKHQTLDGKRKQRKETRKEKPHGNKPPLDCQRDLKSTKLN